MATQRRDTPSSNTSYGTLSPLLGADLGVLLRNFAQDTPQMIERLYDLAIGNDTASLLTMVELLQNSSNNLGLDPLSEACRQLQTIARRGDVASSMMAVGKVEFEFMKAQEAIAAKRWTPPGATQKVKRY